MKKIPSSLSLLLWSSLTLAQLPSPESQLGFRVGTDRKLADWNEITRYFELLDHASNRMEVVELGKSTEGRPLVMAVITAPENFGRLDDILDIQRRLADPRLVHPDSLTHYLRRGRAVVMINCSIHSTEIAASQMAMELAYKLASAGDEATREILDNVVLLLLPSSNPDGIQLVVDWYEKYLGTPYEGSSPPRLYHPYAGHDDNRDWFMLNLAETKLITAALYQKWFPQILYDVHQMGQKGPRFFVPPFYEVSNPNIDPIILRSILLIGGHVTTDLAAAGFTGIATEWTFDTWWHGGMRTAPYYHNTVGLLSEAASCKLATPIEIKFEELSGSGRGLLNAREFQTNFPEPWKGGWWRLRDIVDLELTACHSVLTVAARYRDRWLHNFYRLGQRALEKGEKDSPRAFVIPVSQPDPAAAQKLLDIMLVQGTEILRAKESFVAEGMRHPAGTFVIDCAQPYRANIVALFENQKYPERRRYPGGPLESPYDVTGWTLPLQMGVQVFACSQTGKPKDLVADTLSATRLPVGQLPAGQFIAEKLSRETGDYFVVAPTSLDAYKLTNRLLKNGRPAFWYREGLPDKNVTAGHLLFSTTELSMEEMENAVQDLNVNVTSISGTHSFNAEFLQLPRVGIYRSYVPMADEGWTRLVLEEFEFDCQTLEDGDLRRGQFVDQFDAIIFPDQNDSTILLGRRPDDKENPYPLEFTGGIGTLGLANVRRFVEHGLHCSKRFSGRYETIIWFTKSDDYIFNLDAVRVPQKYPGKKYFKGPTAGQYSSNPLGKNPGDLWVIPNVKSNHVEKTIHPCQFPVELIERLVLSLTHEDDWVFDPFLGVGTAIVAAVRHNRRGAGSEIFKNYVDIAHTRINQAIDGTLRVRPMTRPVFDPKDAGKSLTTAPWENNNASSSKADQEMQLVLLEKCSDYGKVQ